MPARAADGENDRKDEVFLPADTRNWDAAAKGFPNAYVDDDIGADITALREAGAFVWAVFDACHSASATRAAPGESLEVSRRLDPQALGVPAELLASATRAIGGETERGTPVSFPEGSGKGGLVAFFAAQTVETTPEMPLPPDGEEKQRYGLFTYTLIESMAKHPGISYRQLGQTILEAYGAMNRRAPTPLFEGDPSSSGRSGRRETAPPSTPASCMALPRARSSPSSPVPPTRSTRRSAISRWRRRRTCAARSIPWPMRISRRRRRKC
jgi:hypothetical protein